MSSAPIDACQMQIPHTEQVCAWLMQHAGLKTVDLERARRLSTDDLSPTGIDRLADQLLTANAA